MIIVLISSNNSDGINVCTNAFGTYAIITSRSSRALIAKVKLMLSRDTVELAVSSLESHLRVSFPLYTSLDFNSISLSFVPAA